MASTYLQKTGITGSSETAWTISCWVKYTGTSESSIYSAINGSSFSEAYFVNNNTLEWYSYSGGYVGRIVTNRVFTDKNAWYHLTFVWDSNNGTAADRMRLYVNGVRETSFSTETQPSSGASGYINGTFNVGSFRDQTASYMFNGLMTHYHFIDGTAYNADTFGETDATTGIWKPITSPSVTYGTNGFFLDFADSSAMGNDVSGNNNDLTVNGTMTQTIDTPSNVFATGNPLATNYASGLAKGNNEWTSNQTGRGICQATLGMSKGKYYWEVKTVSTHGTNSSDQWNYIGIANGHAIDGDNILGNSGTNSNKLYEYGLYAPDGSVYNNGTSTSYGASFTEGDILSFALDLDNNRCYVAKNGQWCDSGAWSASSPTTYFSVTDPDSTKGGYYFPAISDGGSNVYKVWQFNFGNGYFGTTAVASAGTNSGIGTFEYDVPSGYKALCTKSINEQEYS